jgi:hypothetical protein
MLIGLKYILHGGFHYTGWEVLRSPSLRNGVPKPAPVNRPAADSLPLFAEFALCLPRLYLRHTPPGLAHLANATLPRRPPPYTAPTPQQLASGWVLPSMAMTIAMLQPASLAGLPYNLWEWVVKHFTMKSLQEGVPRLARRRLPRGRYAAGCLLHTQP